MCLSFHRIRHLGLELLGIIKQISPALIEICVSMAVLCPSFEVAANALRGFGIRINDHLLQNITMRFAKLAKSVRVECHGELLTISQFDEDGKKIKSVSSILDGSCGSLDDFFELLKQHLLSINIDEASWKGNINEIADLVKEKLVEKRNAPKTALKKLNEYFGVHSRFQYKTFRDYGLPTGSGIVESAIRRVINLRIKVSGLFWKREHAENIIFLRSLVLTGKLKNACRKGLGVVRKMFDNNTIGSLPLAAK